MSMATDGIRDRFTRKNEDEEKSECKKKKALKSTVEKVQSK